MNHLTANVDRTAEVSFSLPQDHDFVLLKEIERSHSNNQPMTYSDYQELLKRYGPQMKTFSFSSIQHLDLTVKGGLNIPLDDEALGRLTAQFPALRSLQIETCLLTNTGLECLKKYTDAEALILRFGTATQPTKDAVEALAKELDLFLMNVQYDMIDHKEPNIMMLYRTKKRLTHLSEGVSEEAKKRKMLLPDMKV